MDFSSVVGLIEDGYTLTWANQKGEYWDEFVAEKGKKTRTVVINRNVIKRDPSLNQGDPNKVVMRRDDGTFSVAKP